MNTSTKSRSLYKAITWRCVATCDTCLLAWLISGSVAVGLSIGLGEIFTKIAIYYVHERAWAGGFKGLWLAIRAGLTRPLWGSGRLDRV